MAAHAVTGLTQIIAGARTMPDDQFFGILRSALDLSCWTEDLDLDLWRNLDHYCQSYEQTKSGSYRWIVQDVAIAALPFYVIKWSMLGFPGTREQWHSYYNDTRDAAEDVYLRWEAETTKMIEEQSAPLPLPVTGVVSQHSLESWALDNETVDLDWEEHLATCESEDHDDCGYESYEPTLLLGNWKKDEKGQYNADWHGDEDYAAIFNTGLGTVQVVWSEHTKMCRKCSPCYPFQGDLDTPGDDYLAYNMPPEMWREDDNVS